jgi:hypothetical protein
MQATIDCLSARVTWLETQYAKYKALDAEIKRIATSLELHKRTHKYRDKKK